MTDTIKAAIEASREREKALRRRCEGLVRDDVINDMHGDEFRFREALAVAVEALKRYNTAVPALLDEVGRLRERYRPIEETKFADEEITAGFWGRTCSRLITKCDALRAENERLRGLTTDQPDHGNEYAIVCHYKNESDSLRSKLAKAREATVNAVVFVEHIERKAELILRVMNESKNDYSMWDLANWQITHDDAQRRAAKVRAALAEIDA